MKYLAILDRFIHHVESNYLAFDSIAGWSETKASIRRDVVRCTNEDDFETLISKWIQDTLQISHCQLISRATKVAADEQSELETAPNFLKIKHWQSSMFTYVKIPTLALPLFSMQQINPILKSAGTRHIILDLRLNTGGSASSTGDLLGCFLGPQIPYVETKTSQWKTQSQPVIVPPYPESKNKDHRLEVESTMRNHWQRLVTACHPSVDCQENRLTVLIGQRTYSCGEVFAKAIQEAGKGVLIGEKTAGAVVGARDDFDCSHGYSVMLPVFDFLFKEGSIEGVGVKPDIAFQWKNDDTSPLNVDTMSNILKI